MDWTLATMEVCVITSVFGSTALCCLAGFHMRSRIERRIRGEYRELFGACRRSMAQANEYAASLASLESRKTTEFRPRARIEVPLPPAFVHRKATVERDVSILARKSAGQLARAPKTEADDA